MPTIKGMIKKQADQTPVSGVELELLFQLKGKAFKTLKTSVDKAGWFEIAVDADVLPEIGTAKTLIDVVAQVWRNGTEQIPVTNNPLIKNLKRKDYEVEVLVDLPVVARGRISGIVRSVADNAVVPGAAVELEVQSGAVDGSLLRTTTDGEGRFQVHFDKTTILPLWQFDDLFVLAKVWRNETESIPVTNNPLITSLAVRDYNVDILVALPAAATGRLTGFVRSATDRTGVPGIGVRITFSRRTAIGAPLVQLLTTQAWTTPHGSYELTLDPVRMPFLREPNIVVTAEVWRDDIERIPSTPVEPLPLTGLRDHSLSLEVQLELAKGPYSVSGRVTDAGSVAASGLAVIAVDRDMRREEPLGSATTDGEGRYRILYSSTQFTRAEKGSADLVVRVMGADGKTVLGASPVRFNAQPHETIDIRLKGSQFQGPSEYERHVANMRPVMEDVTLSALTDADLEFLTGETGIPLAQLEAIRLDAQWRDQSSSHPFPPATFYGLLRQGLPKTLPALLRQVTQRWRDALTQSLAKNEVPHALSTQLDQIIQSLTALAVDHAFVPAPERDGEVQPLGVLLAATGLSTEQVRLIARTSLTLAQNVDEATWTHTLQNAGVSEQAVNRARFAIQAHTLFDKHVPTLAQLQQTVAQNYASIADLAQLSRTQWLGVAKGLETKKQLPKGFTDAATYGQSLANGVEVLFPTKVLAHHLTTTTQPLRQAVGQFLLVNPSFDLLHTPVDSFVATAKMDGITVTREALKAQLGKEARLARLTPVGDRPAQIERLLEKGFDSAVKIAALGRKQFISTMSPSIGNAGAGRIYGTATERTNELVLRAIQVGELVSRASPMLPGTTPAPTGELATWAAMFGHGNGCSCSPCESAHGPAAYLMDLFEFLKDKDADGIGGNRKTLLEILFDRRPDLKHLLLNCANADTPLPYIDLVIELLERLIANVWSADSTRQTPETLPNTTDVAAHLRAMPMEERNTAVSNIYANGNFADAVFPWNLPFDPRHAYVDLYFRAVGITPLEIVSLTEQSSQDAHRLRLRLSPREWAMLHLRQESSADAVALAWGLTERTPTSDSLRLDSFTAKGGVTALLERSGISFDDLFMLIKSPLFGGWGLSIDRTPTEQADPCNINDAQLRHGRDGAFPLDAQIEVFDLMHRVLRLRAALQWPLPRVTLALLALGMGKIHRQLDLISLSRLTALSAKLGVSVEHLSSLLIALESSEGLVGGSQTHRAWLAMLQLSVTDHDHLLQLGLPNTLAPSGEFPTSTAPSVPPFRPTVYRLELLEAFVADLELLRAARIDPSELRYLLLGQDVIPPAFEPSDSTIAQHLAGLKTAIDTAFASLAPLPADAVPSARDAHQKLWLQLRAPAVEEHLREITGFAGVAFVVPGLQVVPEGTPPEPTLLSESNVLDQFENFARTSSDAAVKQQTIDALGKITRICRLLQLLNFNEVDTRALARLQASGLPWLNFNRLPLAAHGNALSLIQSLLEASVAQARMSTAEVRVLVLAAMDSGEQALDVLEAGTGWGGALAVSAAGRAANLTDGKAALKLLIETLRFPADAWWKRPARYLMLQQAAQWLQQRRMKLSPARDGLPLRNDLEVLLEATQTYLRGHALGHDGRALMEALRSLARSHFPSESEWYKAMTPAMDRLRVQRRDALLSYILHNDRYPWKTAEEVYAFLLLDVQMGPCQLTSRIVQAHSTVQLFVQRCLMNLETASGVVLGNVSDIAEWRQWDWMKNYRVWEAARKVFLYPENWIEPDLRDVKSPFFEDLENELLQDDITPENAERAVRGYLTKLHEVARLDIRALYEEAYTEPLDNGRTATRRVIHMVGRTHAVPHIYYYRKRLDDSTWTPWEKIELSIDSDHLTLVVHNKRPMLFWPQFKEVQPNRSDPSRTAWDVRLSWSVRDQGRWEAPRSSSNFLTISAHDLIRKMIALRTVQNGQELATVLYEFRFFHRDGFSRNVPSGEFSLQSCSGRLNALQLQGDAGRSLSKPVETILVENKIIGIHDTSAPLFYTDTPSFAILGAATPRFELTPTHQYSRIGVPQPFVYADKERQFIATSQKVPWLSINFITSQVTWEGETVGYQFETLYHPYSCLMLKSMDEGGLAGLYRSPERSDQPIEYTGMPPGGFPRQLIREAARTFEEKYKPTMLVWRDEKKAPFVYPIEEFDFAERGAYSLYNWEVFFHVPLLLADRLSKAGKYQDAQQWFHSIFDPTDVSSHGSPQKYWRVRPFFDESERWRGAAESLETMLRRLSLDAVDVRSQVEAWRNDPFNPHLLARIRLVSYMKTVVQKYIENLISWADSLFRRDTIESINEATQLYVLGSEILGPAPTVLPPMPRTYQSYDKLQSQGTVDEFANVLVDLETAMPIAAGHASAIDHLAPGLSTLYFCIPSNPQLRDLRATINDRLFKIRHCMDIDGRTRQLALFAPPIDPALLVRARAAGLDIGTALDMALSPRQSPYRFQSLLQKALEFTNEVRSFGGALLSALEKRDSEQLSQLRARHEVGLLKMVSEVKRQQIEEAEKQLEAVRESRGLAELRKTFYTSREFMNREEQIQIKNMNTAHVLETYGQEYNLLASVLHVIPDTQVGPTGGPTFGGRNLGDAMSAVGSTFAFIASQFSFQANMSAIMAGHERRADDWQLQADLAKKELDQIKQQIEAAEIRLDIAKQEQRNHEQQIAQAEQSEAFLRDKFSNAQLYNWMSAQLSALHYQAYRMAFDLAKQAEAAAHREVDTTKDMIRFDHWDSGRKGLLAGERLGQDLRRLEVAYMQANTRRLELTTHVSLRRLDAIRLLKLRTDGSCAFEIPSQVFNLDFPGHENRRIKSVSISVPGVVGPYVGVHGVLKLVRPTDFVASSTTIATSSGQNDAGVFQLDFRDERYLPFEGVGLDTGTTWEFTLPGTRAFDYNTISDVILHIQYTAQEVVSARGTGPTTPSPVAGSPGTRFQLLDVRHDFPEAWRRLREGSTSERVALRDELFPYFVKFDDIRDAKVRRAGDVIDTIADGSFNISNDDLGGPWKGFLVVEYHLR